MKILFLDRLYHSTTGSAKFFEKLLKQHFEVDLKYVDGVALDELLDGHKPNETLVILWQCEIIAPEIRQRGFATLLIPMWDGVSTLSHHFWNVLSGIPAISFSYTLHQRMQIYGLKSFLTQYAPDTIDYPAVQNYDKPRFFFWNRGAGEAMDSFSAARIALGYNAELTIHEPDRLMEHPVSHLPLYREPLYSNWYESKTEFLQELCKHNIYFAPRLNEGIGFGFLDAMACGMVVVGNNSATMNEYIKNRANGILRTELLNPYSTLDIFHEISQLAEMGRAARETVRRAHEGWKLQEPQIINYLHFVFDQTSEKPAGFDVPEGLITNLRYCLIDIDDLNRLANLPPDS